MRSKVFALTEGISGKDLSDTKAGVLSDHLNQTMLSANPAITSSPFFEKYVLAPRIDLEILSPWRSFLGKNFGNDMAEATRKNINILTDWMNSNIRVDAMANKHSRAPLTPIGVYNLRVADPVSRDIFFVAACRTFGIPARLNPETHVPEYIKGDTWLQAGFESIKEQPESGELYLIDKNNNLTPQYSLHFTIARIHGGVCHTLEFEEGKRLTDFPNPMKLEIGDYLLVTGKRLSDGSVLSSLSFFNISVKKPVSIEVTLRNETTLSRSYGKISPEKINLMETGNQKEVPLNTLMQNENSILVLMDPESEPSKHILNDLAPYVDQYNSLNMNFIFVTTPGKRSVGNIFRNYKTPVRSQFTADIKDELAKAFTALTGRQLSDILPVVVFCRPSGEIPMISEGYKIGIGEQVLQVISREETKSGKPATTKCTTP
jgi:hypothetical protein